MKSRLLISIILLLSAAGAVSACQVDSTAHLCSEHRQLQWKRSLTGAVSAFAVNAVATEVLKHSINEMRPDRSDNSSFPSRHSSYAFVLASVASHELARYSPFWVTAAYTVANAVGMQRVYGAHHYPSDVLAGAALGLLSGEAGYALSRLFFGAEKCPRFAADNLPAVTAATVVHLPLARRPSHGYSTGCGIESSLGISLPVSERWGVGLSLRLRDVPVYRDAVYEAMLKSCAATADVYFATPVFDGSWAVDGAMALGAIRNFSNPSASAPAWSALADLSAGINRQLCRRLSVGCRVGCDLTRRTGPDAALSVALVTKAMF